MNKEIEKKPSSVTLKLRSSNAGKTALGQESLNTGDFPAKEDTIAMPAPKFNFSTIL